MLSKRIRNLFIKANTSKLSTNELEELYHWYEQFGEHEELIEQIVDEDPNKLSQIRADLLDDLNRISHKNTKTKSRKLIFFDSWIGYAAAFAMIVATGALWITLRGNQNETVTEKIVNTSHHQSLHLTLPDSSSVWLKPNSSVRYWSNLNQTALREVTLQGDGFFEVRHDTSRPFIVHTEGMDIKVLGTSFNVRSFASDSTIETALISGRIRIETPLAEKQTAIELMPSQHATFSKKSMKVRVNKIDNTLRQSAPISHTEKISMVFDGRPVTEVLNAIEKKFNLRIFYDERHSQSCLITIDFEKESLQEILDMLEYTQGISYTLHRNELYLKGHFCKFN